MSQRSLHPHVPQPPQKRVGADRITMRLNPLITGTELGRVRKPSYALPSQDFSYGLRTSSRDGGAAEALGGWGPNDDSGRHAAPKMRRDFVKLNRAAVSAGMTNARELHQFSSIHDFKARDTHGKRSKRSDTYPPPGMTFGVATRPSTPLWDVLGNKYQKEWIDSRYDPQESEITAPPKTNFSRVYETHSSVLRRFVEPPDPRPLWQMEKFRKVPPQLKTFRSRRAREDSYTAHALDRVGREGTIGHGIYSTAQT